MVILENGNLDSLLAEYVDRSKEILAENLAGIYLHGSAVMGCYNPKKSDIDIIIVIDDDMTNQVKQAYMDMVVRLHSLTPAKGIEMSIVTKQVCNPFVYPTPFELHFSEAHLQWYMESPDDYIQKMNGTDQDLAAHFMVIRWRGRCLYGLPIEEIFAEVPKRDYVDSIYCDIAEAPEEISENTMYVVLNLARVLAYLTEGRVLSKKEGGEWALKNLPEEFHSLVQGALQEYAKGDDIIYDADGAKRYAEYMLAQINDERDGTWSIK